MTYAEADRLSKKNKEFIKGLFPEGAIYASLLPQHAQDVIGKVGAETRGVEKMLRRIGFRYAWRVDPFDGGPHFTAPTDEVTLVQRTHEARVTKLPRRERHAEDARARGGRDDRAAVLPLRLRALACRGGGRRRDREGGRRAPRRRPRARRRGSCPSSDRVYLPAGLTGLRSKGERSGRVYAFCDVSIRSVVARWAIW